MTTSQALDLRRLPALARQQIASAQLPDNYVAAKKALAACIDVDQVKDIADKHAAIAHYAKQIKDNSLRFYAERVYLRAQRRLGELLNDLTDLSQSTYKARKKLADKVRIDPTHMQQASYIARIPEKAFDQAVESDPPPSKSALIQASRKKRSNAPLREGPRIDAEWSEPYMRACSIFTGFENAISQCGYGNWPDAGSLARSLALDEAEKIKKRVVTMIDWLDEFDGHLASAISKRH